MGKFYTEQMKHKTAEMKRLLERLMLIPGEREAYQENEEVYIKSQGLDLTHMDVACKPLEDGQPLEIRPIHPKGGAAYYKKFCDKKIKWRDQIKEDNTPQGDTMKKWRIRQIARCRGMLGLKYEGIVHEMLAIELSSGCSVGCPFCGLKAEKLCKVFTYTDEHAALFRDVLKVTKKVIGPGVKHAPCYYATEPLDNPDYEKFIDIFYETFKTIPQVTTAVAMRDPERTRGLIQTMQERYEAVFRFSIRDLLQAEQILDYFTPEELLLVELLPQYEEAPLCALSNVGRRAEDKEEYGGTISCISGFIINMAEQSVRLVTPTPSSKQFPTGEITLAKEYFKTAEELEKIMNDMIADKMKILLEPKEKIKMYPHFHYENKNGKQELISEAGAVLHHNEGDNIPNLKHFYELLKSGLYTKEEMAMQLYECGEETDPGSLFKVYNFLWRNGIIVDHSLYPSETD